MITILALLTNVTFIGIFYLRKRHLLLVEQYGKWTFLLIIPALVSILIAILESEPPSTFIILGIYVAFMILEFFLDHYWKLDFRHNWKLLTPYLVLYYVMNYGLVIMPWTYSTPVGIITLAFFIFQLGMNIYSHQSK